MKLSAPTILFGRTANALWWDAPNGDLLLSVGEQVLPLHRNAKGQFPFGHDDLMDSILDGLVTDAIRDGKGNFIRFRLGPLAFTVEEHNLGSDVYYCREERKREPLVIVPRKS